LTPLHDATWWAAQTKGMNFSVEDHLDSAKFNRVLWQGTMGNKPYPTVRSGLDLRSNRPQLLKDFQDAQKRQTQGASNNSAQENVTVQPSGAGN